MMLILAGAVNAAMPTRLNITLSETVDQNVTFASDFTLDESTDYCTITGIANITNPNAEGVADITMFFTNTENMLTNFTWIAGRAGSQTRGNVGANDTFVIHITELLQNNFTTFQYSINCTDVEPPLNIGTSYSNAGTGINRKVLAGQNWTVTQNVSNQLAIAQTINNVNIIIRAQNVTWNTSAEPFELVELLPLGDYSNVSGNGTSTEVWTWNANGGAVAPATSVNISYLVQAPDNVPTSNTYMAIQETLTYEIYYLASNLSLNIVTAIADVDFDLDKKIVQPADNNNNTNVTWEVNGDVSAPFNISYNLTKVTVWVTETLDPNDYNTSFGLLNNTYIPGEEVNLSNAWSATPWYFNYTDASNNASSRPPIVWLKPYFTILNAYGQIVNTSITRNGADLYMKYIYVVNGYWLQINKNITNIGEDQYRIDTLVENIGNA